MYCLKTKKKRHGEDSRGYSVVHRLLRRGSMFVFSTDQIRQLLNITYFASGSTLVDLGAGDGATTEKYMPLVQRIYTTEKSGPMIRILTRKGFR